MTLKGGSMTLTSRLKLKTALQAEPEVLDNSRWHWYNDLVQTRRADFLDELKQGAFGNSWIFLGEASSLREPGEFYSDELAGRLVMVCRNRQRKLKGFYNTCRHQGAAVARVRHGRTRHFTCPYHGWAYDLDGNLRAVPLLEGYSNCNFRQEDYGLLQVPVTEVGGMIFGSLSDRLEAGESFFADAVPYMEGLFATQSGWDVIMDYILRVDMNWQDWMRRSRDCYAEGTTAEQLLGITQAEYQRLAKVKRTEKGHQIVEFKGAPNQEVSLLHLEPNLLAVKTGSALATLRIDPLTDTVSVLRVTGYGSHGEDAAVRNARRRQLQLHWGPAASQLHSTVQA